MADVRARLWFIAQLLKHNAALRSSGEIHPGRFLIIETLCWAHIVTTLVLNEFRYRELIPRVYAAAFIFRFPPRRNRLLKRLRMLVERQLLSGGYTTSTDAILDEIELHSFRILKLVLHRPLRTRGRACLGCIPA